MNGLKQFLVYGTCTIFFLSLAGLLAGSGLTPAGISVAQEVNIDEMLKGSPEKMPQDYSDDEIDQMLDDVQHIDDSADTEGKEDTVRPELSPDDRALVEDIKRNPEKYAEEIKSMDWLDAHPWVVWSVCSDFAWIDVNPHFAARIYLNYDYWCRYPKIAYIIVSNRPFMVRYPRITARIYVYDDWFIQHPFIAREIYMNDVFFVRYPDFIDRYYRHQDWMYRHPGIIRIAYGHPEIFKARPQYLEHVYSYRRQAVRGNLIRHDYLPKMRDRWKHEFSFDRENRDKIRVKYKEQPADRGRDKGQKTGRKNIPDKNRGINKGRGSDKGQQPAKDRTVNRSRNKDAKQPDKGKKGGGLNREQGKPDKGDRGQGPDGHRGGGERGNAR